MPARRLVVCSDGTWNWPDQRGGPTNVVKLLRAIRPTDRAGIPQIMFYDSGVGTGNWSDRIFGGALGWGLGKNVRQGYGFIADNYDRDNGDELFLFGFSRGAFTVRSLAGMISLVGLLPKRSMHLFEKAWDYYRLKPEDRDPSEEGRKAYLGVETRPTKVHFIGVWDTVGALGIPVSPLRWLGRNLFAFHNTTLCSNIQHACQALAIDERRRAFAPVLWTRDTSPAFARKLLKHGIARQNLEQTWFAGAHSNVGGGYEDCALADIALDWMVCRAEDAGLEVDRDYLASIRKATTQRLVNSRTLKWRGRPELVRPLCTTPDERIHRSVLTRMECRDGSIEPYPYLPTNVLELKKERVDRFDDLIDDTGAVLAKTESEQVSVV